MAGNRMSNNPKQEEHFAHSFWEKWLQSWNHRNLETILAHYADEIELRSPMAAHILGDPSGTVAGKQNLREYFQKILTVAPIDLGLELLGVYEGVDSTIVHFKSKSGSGAEVMELNAEGKVLRAVAHFSRLSND